VGAKVVIAPGVRVSSYSILTLGTIITKDTEPWGIYQGNPGVKIKERHIENDVNED